MPVFCDGCGHQNRDSAKFCQGCGGEILATSPDGSMKPGVVLGRRYKINRLIKSGGMGAVYEGFDGNFNRICAVKEMRMFSSNPEDQKYYVERFKAEGQILYDLKHLNLPTVRDYFIESGRYYIVMDYIEGRDFTETLKKDYGGKAFPEERVIALSKQILDVLEYLHNQNPPIVYRDLKPDNVMLQKSDGRAMLIDFGIVRRMTPGSDTTKTAIGTPGFSPAEIFQGKPEPRSDIFSLGATMHYLLTCQTPQPLVAFRPVRDYNKNVSPSLDEIIMKAVDMNISGRYSCAKEMREAIERFEYERKEELRRTVPATVVAEESEVFHPAEEERVHPYSTEVSVDSEGPVGPVSITPAGVSSPSVSATISPDSSGPVGPVSVTPAEIPSAPDIFPPLPLQKTVPVPSEITGKRKSRAFLIPGVIILALLLLTGGFFGNSYLNNPDRYLKIGDEAFGQSDFITAVTNYEKVLKSRPDDLDVLLKIGFIYKDKLSSPDDALVWYEKANKSHPENEEAMSALIALYLTKGETASNSEEATVYYKKVMELDSGNGTAGRKLFSIYRDGKDYNSAKDILDKTSSFGEKDGSSYFSLGKDFYNAEDYQKAIDCFRKVLEVKSGSVDSYHYISKCYMSLGEYEDVIKENEKLMKLSGKDIQAHADTGEAHYNQGNYTAAVKWFEKGLSLNPSGEDKNFLIEKSYSCYMKLGEGLKSEEKYKEASENFQKAYAKKPDSKEAKEKLVSAYISEGKRLYGAQDYYTAGEYFDKVLALEPGQKEKDEADGYIAKIAEATRPVYIESDPYGGGSNGGSNGGSGGDPFNPNESGGDPFNPNG